jgi:hypothetical protein
MADGINVKFSATDAGFSGTVAKVNNSMKSMDDNARKVSGSVKSSFASMAKAGAALGAGFAAVQVGISAIRGTLDDFQAALDMGGELNDLSARTGETAGNLMVLRRAFDNTGAGAEKVGPAINKLQKAIIEAGQGNGAAVAAFERLGLNLEELKYAAPIDQMKAVGEALKGVTNPSERAAIAMQVFGKSGGELLPMLLSMQEEVQNASGELGSLPGVMDRSAASFDALGDKLSVMKGKLTEFAAGILEGALPALNQLINAGASLDAAGFGSEIGKRLGEAFSLITDGSMWEIFKLQAEKAVTELDQPGGLFFETLNGWAAAWNAALDGKVSDGFGDRFDKYAEAGKEATSEVAEALDKRISEIVERNAKKLADMARKMEQEAAERAANSGIMVKDIREPEQPKYKQGLELLKMGVKAGDHMKQGATAIQYAAEKIKEAMTLSESIAKNIYDSFRANQVDPGGRLQARANEAMAKGDFGGAERAASKIAQREQNQNIQDVFGNDRSAKRSLQDIAKEQGIETRGKGSRELRDELSKMADADKQRQREMIPGQGGKAGGKSSEESAREEATSVLTEIKSLVDAIKTTINKIEPKLPTAALGA